MNINTRTSLPVSTPTLPAAGATDVPPSNTATPAPPVEETVQNAGPTDTADVSAPENADFEPSALAFDPQTPTLDPSPEQMEAVLQATNENMLTQMDAADPDSDLGRYAASLRLLSLAENPELMAENGDVGARDLLAQNQVNLAAIQAEYERLGSSPEVVEAYARAREHASETVFGQSAAESAAEIANHLNSPEMAQRIQAAPITERATLIQEAIQELAILDPEQAAEAAGTMMNEHVLDAAQSALGATGAEGEQARQGFADAMVSYLQTAGDVGKAGEAISNLFGEDMSPADLQRMAEDVSGLLEGVDEHMLQDGVRMADHLESRLESIEDPRRQNQARRFIHHIRAQNALESLSTLGAVGGLLGQDYTPDTPEEWAGLLNTGLSAPGDVRTAVQLGRRLAGRGPLLQAIARSGGGSASATRAVSVLAKLSTAADRMAVAANVVGIGSDLLGAHREWGNEDTLGTTTYVVSAASSAVLLAGPAAPIAAVAVGVGLGAMAVNSYYGESEDMGQIRRDLRLLGYSDQDDALQEQVEAPVDIDGILYMSNTDERLERFAQLSPEDQARFLHEVSDGFTPNPTENLIYRALTESSDESFKALLEHLDPQTVAREIDNLEQAREIMDRMLAQSDPDSVGEHVQHYVERLAREHRDDIIQDFLEAHPQVQDQLPPELLSRMASHLASGRTDRAEENLMQQLLTTENPQRFDQIAVAMGSEGLDSVRSELGFDEALTMAHRMVLSENAEVNAIATAFYEDHFFHVPTVAIEVEVIAGLSDAEIAAIPPARRAEFIDAFNTYVQNNSQASGHLIIQERIEQMQTQIERLR